MLKVDELSGAQKAAVLLVQLGKEKSATVLKSLRESEVEEVLNEIARLKGVPDETVDAVFEEFATLANARRYYAQGGMDFAREVLEATLGSDRAKELLERMRPRSSRCPSSSCAAPTPARSCRSCRTSTRRPWPSSSPTCAPTRPRSSSAACPTSCRPTWRHRVAVMETTSPDVVRRVEAILERKLSSVLQSTDASAAGGLKPLVDIINHADRATERLILEGLERRDPALAEEVRSQMFMFEDITTLDDRSVQLVLRSVDSKELATALKGVSQDVRGKIMANVSERAAANLADEIDMLGAVRLSTVEEAQAKIIATIRSLEESGQILLSRGDRDEYVV
jgi:flagellar motor switch protein FliG